MEDSAVCAGHALSQDEKRGTCRALKELALISSCSGCIKRQALISKLVLIMFVDESIEGHVIQQESKKIREQGSCDKQVVYRHGVFFLDDQTPDIENIVTDRDTENAGQFLVGMFDALFKYRTVCAMVPRPSSTKATAK